MDCSLQFKTKLARLCFSLILVPSVFALFLSSHIITDVSLATLSFLMLFSSWLTGRYKQSLHSFSPQSSGAV